MNCLKIVSNGGLFYYDRSNSSISAVILLVSLCFTLCGVPGLLRLQQKTWNETFRAFRD